jgi:hypothetical protein
MKDNLRRISAPHRANSAEPAVQGLADTPATSIERRSPVRQGSRGDERRMSSSVIVHIVQAYDFVLLLFSGLLAQGMLTPLHRLRFDGSLFLATFLGSVVSAPFSFVPTLTCCDSSVSWINRCKFWRCHCWLDVAA